MLLTYEYYISTARAQPQRATPARLPPRVKIHDATRRSSVIRFTVGAEDRPGQAGSRSAATDRLAINPLRNVSTGPTESTGTAAAASALALKV